MICSLKTSTGRYSYLENNHPVSLRTYLIIITGKMQSSHVTLRTVLVLVHTLLLVIVIHALGTCCYTGSSDNCPGLRCYRGHYQRSEQTLGVIHNVSLSVEVVHLSGPHAVMAITHFITPWLSDLHWSM